jgi:PAS domain S-box-containing protein
MNSTIIGLIGLISIVSGFLLIEKAFLAKDYTLLARALPRMYLFLVCLIYWVNPDAIDMILVHLGFFLVLLSDSVIGIFDIIGKKYKDALLVAQLSDMLEKLHNKYLMIIETAQVGFFITDDRGKIEYANKYLLKMMGYSFSEVLGRAFFEYVADKESSDLIIENLHKKLSGEVKTTCYEINLKQKNGKIARVRIASCLTENSHTTITGSVIFAEDALQC